MLSNPRLIVDGASTVSFQQGRRGLLAVDVSDFPGGDLVFELRRHRGGGVWELLWARTKRVPTAAAYTAVLKVRLNARYWALEGSTQYDLLQQSWAAGEDVGYDYESPLLGATDDDTLYAPLKLEVRAPGTGWAPVSTPELRPWRPQFRPGNRVDLLLDGNEALPAILAAIGAAQHHVHIDIFFFSPDSIGTKVIEALKARAQAGVKVRILFDSVLTSVPPPAGPGAGFDAVDAMIEEMTAAGAYVVRAEDPIATDEIPDTAYRDRADEALAWTSADFNNFVFTSGYPFTTRPHGVTDHSKLVVIDGVVGFTGGMNVADAYMFEIPFDASKTSEQEVEDRTGAGLPEAFVKWHDTFVRIQGPVVADMQRYFAERWAQTTGELLDRQDPAYFPPPATFGPASVKFLANVPGNERDVTLEYLRMFARADTRVLVHNPYVTDDLVMLYLCDAARNRGVSVRLFIPDEHHDIKVPYVDLVGIEWRPVREYMRARYGDWLNAGIELYEYRKRMTHVKIATADQRYTLVGSYNMAKHASSLTYECNVLIDDPAFARTVEQRLFDVDLPRSTRITTAPTDVHIPPGTDLAEPIL